MMTAMPERDQQHVAVIAMRGRTDDETLQRVAKPEKNRRQQENRDIGVEAQQPESEKSGEQGRAQHRAMGEIDDMQHAVDQRQSEATSA